MAESATIAPARARPATDTRRTVERPRLWHVILLNDDDHTYEYVIKLLQELFGFSIEKAFEVARRVDTAGRGVVVTVHKELAELKAEQVRHFGPDPWSMSATYPLGVTIEPAERDEDE